MSDEAFISRILKRVVGGRLSIEEAVDLLLTEMGRGGVVLIVDETSYGLENKLRSMGYTVSRVASGAEDWKIKKQLEAKVFVTCNGRRFCDPKDLKRYHYGLVWATSTGDEKLVAQKIKRALMQAHFNSNLEQVVKVLGSK